MRLLNEPTQSSLVENPLIALPSPKRSTVQCNPLTAKPSSLMFICLLCVTQPMVWYRFDIYHTSHSMIETQHTIQQTMYVCIVTWGSTQQHHPPPTITRNHPQPPRTTPGHPPPPTTTTHQPPVTPDHPRSPPITPDHPRSPPTACSGSLAWLRRGDPGEHVSDSFHTSGRPAHRTFEHWEADPVPYGARAVAANPHGVTLSRPVYRKTDAPLTRLAAQR